MKVNNTRINNNRIYTSNELGNKKTKQNDDAAFNDYLNEAMNKVNDLQIDAENYKKLLATGELDNLHDLTIAAEKANIGLQFITGIRNKVIEAYREIMRMQI